MPALPPVQLRIEVRTVSPPRPLRLAEQLKPGAVVTSTAGRVDGAGAVTVRAAASASDARGGHVVVANGQRALLRWHETEERHRLEYVWTAQGQGVTGGADLHWRAVEWVVSPRWAAEGEPVELTLAAQGGPSAAVQVQTVVSVPFARWHAVARSVGEHTDSEVQVRVTLTGP